MIVYEIHMPFLRLFAKEGVPFMTFDQYGNLVKLYRDDFYATQHVDMFAVDVGVKYLVWTYDAHAHYYRNVFFDQIDKPMYISFEIPDAESNAVIPLHVKVYDDDGVIFAQEQKLMVSRFANGAFHKTGWRKVPEIRAFVESENTAANQAA